MVSVQVFTAIVRGRLQVEPSTVIGAQLAKAKRCIVSETLMQSVAMNNRRHWYKRILPLAVAICLLVSALCPRQISTILVEQTEGAPARCGNMRALSDRCCLNVMLRHNGGEAASRKADGEHPVSLQACVGTLAVPVSFCSPSTSAALRPALPACTLQAQFVRIQT